MKRSLENISYENRTVKKNFDIILISGKKLFNFSSNDYLSLSKNTKIINESKKWSEIYGSSLSSSRFVSGNLDKISVIESKLSEFTGKEKSLIFSGGFLMNSTLIPTLTGNTLGQRNKVEIFSDKLNHASINYGCYLTRQRVFRYNHLDLNHLEYLLKKSDKKTPKFIISETLFSMDGDLANVKELRVIAKKYNAVLYLDEAHSIGIYGKDGSGCAFGKKYEKEIVVGTFGKSFGSFGSFVSTSEDYVKKIINFCGGLIYTTALPPSVYASIHAALKIVPKLNKERKNLFENSKFLRTKLNKLNIDTGNTQSHIIPIILKDEKKCLKLKKKLENKGFFLKIIKSPTVLKGTERIRLSLTSSMKKKSLSDFCESMKKILT